MNYKVQAVNSSGKIVSVFIDSSNITEAKLIAKKQGLSVLEISAQRNGFLSSKLSGIKKSKFPLILFNQELISLLEAGLSIVEAIETLLDKERNIQTKAIISAIVSSLREGNNLSSALEKQTAIFPELYIASIKSSEKSGDLLESIKRYLAYQIQVDFVKKKIISAAIYPALLLCVGGLVVIFLMTYVVPKFSHIYSDSGRELPLLSWVLMRWGEMVEQNGTSIFLVSTLSALLIIYGFTLPSFKNWIKRKIEDIPILGERIRIYQLTRFYRALGMLTASGIPLVRALDQVSPLLDIRLRQKLKIAKKLINEGIPLSQAVEQNALSTPIAERLLKVGEKTGQMGEMMNRIADFHEDELNRWIDWASKLLEPILMTIIGIVIGGIVVLMYIPIFELAGSIQ